MSDRFAGLKKIPREPARRLLALGNARLLSDLDAPAAAPVAEVLAELDARGARADMLRLLAVALPARECIWWGCLAAGDLVGADAPLPPPLAAARAWVFKPNDDTRAAARAAAEAAEPDDDTVLAANAVALSDGKIGTGDLAAIDAPAGAVGTFVFGLNVLSMTRVAPEAMEAQGDRLIERALDIARGGNGRLGSGAAGSGLPDSAGEAGGAAPGARR